MTKYGKKLTAFGIISVLVFTFKVYNAVPDRITLIDGSGYGISSVITGFESGTSDLKLFGLIPYKTVKVDIIPDKQFIPSGKTVGIDIDVDGVLVLGLADITCNDGTSVCPAAAAGITTGDVIKEINGETVTSITELERYAATGEILTIVVQRGDAQLNVTASPVADADGVKKIGVWVREGTTGIGTVTYVSPDDGSFGALGHPITDADTESIITVGMGAILDSSILGVEKSERGLPGEIRGTVAGGTKQGEIYRNTEFGIFGKMYDLPNSVPMSVLTKDNISIGSAYIMTDIVTGTPEKYEVEIQHISLNSVDNKGMVIKVTDRRLLDKTGGIVQGMSGSPLIQSGRLAGAVTHVFVNDPTRGYASFIEYMLTQ